MKKEFLIDRIKDILWVLAMAGLVAGVGRFVFGLGAATNMTDALPWGMWKILNMVGGAALATSGFVVACVIYIFHLEKYRPLARLAILIGFLGYGASLFALLFDIGLPHRFWHPFFIWNPHSFLFEVFWCVSCYWMVTAFEMFPVITERFPFPRLTHFLHEIALPVIILGITLSTMHHSSLGSLFMVSPTRLHPLWHTLWIPVEFFISAMGGGMAVIVMLSLAYGWLYGKGYNMPVLTGMAKGSAGMLLIYLIIRSVDLVVHDKLNYVFGPDLTWESAVFLVEISLQALIPLAVFLVPRLRNNVQTLALGTVAAFIGITMHRLDTGIVGYFRDAGAIYYPTLSEVLLSFGVIAAAGLFFLFIIEHFYIVEAPEGCPVPEAAGSHPDEAAQWTLDEAFSIVFSPNTMRVAAIVMVVIPVTIVGLHRQATGPFRYNSQPVAVPLGIDPMRTVLKIDGNREAEFVNFPHNLHQEEQGGEESCGLCHHLAMPGDKSTSCYQCHRDMELTTDIFDHDGHQEYYGGKKSCAECHDLDRPKGGDNVPTCAECHADPEEADLYMAGIEEYQKLDYMAPGYKQAMHGRCLTCHRLQEQLLEEPAWDEFGIGNCKRCHQPDWLEQTAQAGPE